MSLKLNSSGGGSVTVQEPSTASNVTFNLPSETATAIYSNASGNVGIGTSSPSTKLNVVSAGDRTLIVQSGTDTPAKLVSTVANSYLEIANSTNSFYVGAVGSNAAFVVNGAERARIDSSGNLLVGTTSAVASSRLLVKGSGTSSATVNIYVQNSAETEIFYMRDDGAVNTGTTTSSPYNLTTGTAANAVLGSDGFLRRSTSSLKYKTDIQDADHGLTELLKLRSVTYKGNNDGNIIFGGLIAEEVDAAGLVEFVQYADDGSPDALAYGNMVALCIKAIQEQQAMIEELKAKVAALEAK
jgi:hypothetical protein